MGGRGPSHYKRCFFPSRKVLHCHRTRLQEGRHNRQLHDYLNGEHNELVRRSLLSLPQFYNCLRQEVVNAKSVATFQKKLTNLVRNKLRSGDEKWEHCLTVALSASVNVLSTFC